MKSQTQKLFRTLWFGFVGRLLRLLAHCAIPIIAILSVPLVLWLVEGLSLSALLGFCARIFLATGILSIIPSLLHLSSDLQGNRLIDMLARLFR
jgi:hypothetical protein